MATGELSAKQHKAIVALLSEPTIKAAAESIGVGERTLHTWLDDPIFDTAYRAALRKAVRQATGRLQRVSGAAVSVLVSLMASSTPAVKLGAARTILEYTVKAIELEDLAARMAALEAEYEKS